MVENVLSILLDSIENGRIISTDNVTHAKRSRAKVYPPRGILVPDSSTERSLCLKGMEKIFGDKIIHHRKDVSSYGNELEIFKEMIGYF